LILSPLFYSSENLSNSTPTNTHIIFLTFTLFALSSLSPFPITIMRISALLFVTLAIGAIAGPVPAPAGSTLEQRDDCSLGTCDLDDCWVSLDGSVCVCVSN
jgi:hypothetical protein